MASGHANRANRPNTWLHRPATRREVLTCQPGAVHTWHIADQLHWRSEVRYLAQSGPWLRPSNRYGWQVAGRNLDLFLGVSLVMDPCSV
jgi:hypothetical protein